MRCAGELCVLREVELAAAPAVVSSTEEAKAAGRPLAFSAEESIH
jgi:hypothetical protein